MYLNDRDNDLPCTYSPFFLFVRPATPHKQLIITLYSLIIAKQITFTARLSQLFSLSRIFAQYIQNTHFSLHTYGLTDLHTVLYLYTCSSHYRLCRPLLEHHLCTYSEHAADSSANPNLLDDHYLCLSSIFYTTLSSICYIRYDDIQGMKLSYQKATVSVQEQSYRPPFFSSGDHVTALLKAF